MWPPHCVQAADPHVSPVLGRCKDFLLHLHSIQVWGGSSCLVRDRSKKISLGRMKV